MNWARKAGTAWLALALTACGGDGPPASVAEPRVEVTEPDAYEFKLDAPREIVTRDDAFRVTWFPEGGVVPINEHFVVDVTLTKNDAARTPVEGADVTMSCFMPEHGHGMLREPRSEELGKGQYQVKGFLLHMDGYWTVSVNVLVDGLAATAEDELRL
jgi:hypothetical protein